VWKKETDNERGKEDNRHVNKYLCVGLKGPLTHVSVNGSK
jgi:hypothetical protein